MQVTIIYGQNKRAEREDLWKELRTIGEKHGNVEEPWILMGNFNEIRVISEREGRYVHDEEEPSQFNKVIEDLDLTELPTMGGLFTWSNKNQGEGLVQSKLYRMLVKRPGYPSGHRPPLSCLMEE